MRQHPPPGRESGEVTKLYSPLYYYMGNRPGGPAREKLTGYTPPPQMVRTRAPSYTYIPCAGGEEGPGPSIGTCEEVSMGTNRGSNLDVFVIATYQPTNERRIQDAIY